MPVLAVDVLSRLIAHPTLAKTLQFQQVQRLLEFTRRIWPEIVGNTGVVPVLLPPHATAFLSSVLRLPHDIIALSWLAFSDVAASLQQDPVEPSLNDEFCLHTNDHRIGQYPPYLLPPKFKLIQELSHKFLPLRCVPDPPAMDEHSVRSGLWNRDFTLYIAV